MQGQQDVQRGRTEGKDPEPNPDPDPGPDPPNKKQQAAPKNQPKNQAPKNPRSHEESESARTSRTWKMARWCLWHGYECVKLMRAHTHTHSHTHSHMSVCVQKLIRNGISLKKICGERTYVCVGGCERH
ncbi:hypothetical protein M5D96_007259 [Drosophila gunungcola]|uniref:Uncharacterized protein n=1 Tax=Drosophila gunungcola TaxID=103775 RepID=A0A9P9YMN4_9MUSC|nr:hypothetical protein M5D96_007259 [Drosophila gunungcola]